MSRKKKRGFAAMDPVLQKAIASAGGKAAHAQGRAHEYSTAEARAAGRKSHKVGGAHEWTKEEAAAAGRKGAAARARNRAKGLEHD
jgi:general stress protein YciG